MARRKSCGHGRVPHHCWLCGRVAPDVYWQLVKAANKQARDWVGVRNVSRPRRRDEDVA